MSTQMTIYDHVDSNKRLSWVIMFFFSFFVVFLSWVIGEAFVGEGSGISLVGIALIVSGLSTFYSYYYSDQLVLAISGAKEVTVQDNLYLHKLVENMSIASGLPKPKIFMINDTAMNAFATGRDPQHAVICFTSGIVDGLEKRELEGVIAHEMSHIGNYDIRLMSIVSVLVGTITLIADGFTRGMRYGSRSRRRSEGGDIILVIAIISVIISPIIATLIKLAVSRNREYLADSTAALITRYPQGLANALKKLHNDTEVLEAADGATAHLYIDSPIKQESSRFFANLFSTHPPIEERIKRLETM